MPVYAAGEYTDGGVAAARAEARAAQQAEELFYLKRGGEVLSGEEIVRERCTAARLKLQRRHRHRTESKPSRPERIDRDTQQRHVASGRRVARRQRRGDRGRAAGAGGERHPAARIAGQPSR